MRTVNFTTTLTKGNGATHNGKLTLPDPADAFKADQWRKSSLFADDASDDTIRKALVDAVARDAKIYIQRHIRDGARDAAHADQILAGTRYDGALSVMEVPEALFATFTKEQIALLESNGTIVVAKK